LRKNARLQWERNSLKTPQGAFPEEAEAFPTESEYFSAALDYHSIRKGWKEVPLSEVSYVAFYIYCVKVSLFAGEINAGAADLSNLSKPVLIGTGF
ncbi:hypothetical protein, partial [Sediminibacillus massiliensis]|uniref:hypothetical protein n=1 Tax=Sediminibacillus massiliensis TaxID=1926277 RepID=UPI001C4DEA7B